MTMMMMGRQERWGGRGGSALAAAGGRRMLVTMTMVGSAGPIRFVAGEEEPVAAVIGTALRCYTREGRFPVLGCDVGEFHLFCARSDYVEGDRNPWRLRLHTVQEEAAASYLQSSAAQLQRHAAEELAEQDANPQSPICSAMITFRHLFLLSVVSRMLL
ncbi:hypothetical protein Taro_055446 [Colocasia esculenta]|uniref:DUF7054 domain-containing protein n=1 Tax=Colocasia esculenta TaxID=4460 RepID=A0A843XRB3_COLES|nr:hypothetical protein [Colocasia esculenta]